MAPTARHEEARGAADQGCGAPLNICLHRGDAQYPSALEDLKRPPEPLWACGNLHLLGRPCVSIVGTRRATPYAERVARELGRTLAQAGACVVSGLARGVDSAAHRGALEVGGATCAVLGTGINRVYPAAHAQLQDTISKSGVLLSELEPDDQSHGGSFLNRNRIIAALARVTIVVESAERGGALRTASDAMELGRTLAAVPGPIDVPQSLGSNLLLLNGAVPITSMVDALTLMGLVPTRHLADLPAGGTARRLWEALEQGPADMDTLSSRAAVPASEAVAGVSQLELLGFVECALSGEIRRI